MTVALRFQDHRVEVLRRVANDGSIELVLYLIRVELVEGVHIRDLVSLTKKDSRKEGIADVVLRGLRVFVRLG